MVSVLLAMGLATPAWAQEASGDDHAIYHQELAGDHELVHQELGEELRQADEEEAARHMGQHRASDGCGLGHWLSHRRAERRRRLREERARREHAAHHAEASAEHEVYHAPPAAYDVYAPSPWILPRRVRLRPFGW
jgi:hypothetical protein